MTNADDTNAPEDGALTDSGPNRPARWRTVARTRYDRSTDEHLRAAVRRAVSEATGLSTETIADLAADDQVDLEAVEADLPDHCDDEAWTSTVVYCGYHVVVDADDTVLIRERALAE